MITYSSRPVQTLCFNEWKIDSFSNGLEKNIDPLTVKSFGEEWTAFHDFSPEEIEKLGQDYFDLLPADISNFIALDIGCGSGRWAAYLAKRLSFIEAIDPSSAVFAAKKLLLNKNYQNVRVTHASVDAIPFPDESFDLVYTLGVLHHVPDTEGAVKQCYAKVKRGGYFLLYLYYNLENRGLFFKGLFNLSTFVRKKVSSLKQKPKQMICNAIAAFVYWPLAKLTFVANIFSEKLASQIPLSYYRKTSFFVMRNDALDRFGTPLEKRFSKKQITDMLEVAGFVNIQFSQREPYWHVIAQRP
jgi:SAM-dependent methyltransferase